MKRDSTTGEVYRSDLDKILLPRHGMTFRGSLAYRASTGAGSQTELATEPCQLHFVLNLNFEIPKFSVYPVFKVL